jgi:hypothetical protein
LKNPLSFSWGMEKCYMFNNHECLVIVDCGLKKVYIKHDCSHSLLISAHVAQQVEHLLGKDEVTSSILVVGFKKLVNTKKF